MNNKKVTIWHEEAMDLAEMAFFAKRRGEYYNFWKFIQRALNYEKAAARVLIEEQQIEPTRSLLYKSAIHFALNLDHFDEAKFLLREANDGNPPIEVKNELDSISVEINQRENIKSRAVALAQSFLDSESLEPSDVSRAINASIAAVENFFGKETIEKLLNRIALEVSLENKNLVLNPDYQIFESVIVDRSWIAERRQKLPWSFWKAYKIYLDKKNFASTTIKKLDQLTDDILSRLGDPSKSGVWDKRGMIVGDVQSGKTSNYVGLINKAADLGFRIIIVLTGLYENLRQQTQERIDEGFIGAISDLNNQDVGKPIGVENYRTPKNLPVHPITRAGDAGDLRKSNLPNLPINTNDYYAIVVKKNPTVLKTLLNWLHARGENDGEYKIIKNRPLLVIDDEADYASLNVDNDFVSKINGSIRAILALFEQSAFIGYTATPFANVFISDHNETSGHEILIDRKRFRLGEDLFPRDFIINIPSPSNYIGYSKVFDTKLKLSDSYVNGDMPMINIVNDYEPSIPKGHKKNGPLPNEIPLSLKDAIKCFFLACAVRSARGQEKEHNSMLIHASWYVKWLDQIAWLVNEFTVELKKKIKSQDDSTFLNLKSIWEKEFKPRTASIISQVGYDDPRIIEHNWNEIQFCLVKAVEKIEVRAVHGAKKGLKYLNTQALNYKDYKNGLSVIAIGGNKLSRGLTLEGLSISYFLRATRFYDTLLQMGRWFGYRPGYVDLCRLFTTKELITWYQYIANATDELKEQFDIMDLADRTPKNFGLKVRSAPGMLMISSAAKIKGATDLNLSFSGDLQETYILSKSADSLNNNLLALNNFIENLGPNSDLVRQGQKFIWEGVKYNSIDSFIANYKIHQRSIHPDFLRGYIMQQLKNGNLSNWTVVLIHNSNAKDFYTLKASHSTLNVGYTFRKEVEEKDAFGNTITDHKKYLIRKSHIISPPHEYLDMDESDMRYIKAKEATAIEAKTHPTDSRLPAGKYIRKFRGSKNALLIIYVLDPLGFGGHPEVPAIGFAMSFPEIVNDEKIPYKVNQQFIEGLFEIPDEAIENPEDDDDQ
ncbi:MAG: putative endonuclease, domain protein [Ferruginibacter sp.]|uniref:Z1 domain-containing protein n=1 Tax=Ferruginibacter sp. TaxID=1940288 RepID=UPI002659FD25|nr:Z1 domain-containing protein [Ferruginibacter sp.]MDB5279057.1 putative endonuclease, domain protein [Ferruginibacter sp.]